MGLIQSMWIETFTNIGLFDHPLSTLLALPDHKIAPTMDWIHSARMGTWHYNTDNTSSLHQCGRIYNNLLRLRLQLPCSPIWTLHKDPSHKLDWLVTSPQARIMSDMELQHRLLRLHPCGRINSLKDFHEQRLGMLLLLPLPLQDEG